MLSYSMKAALRNLLRCGGSLEFISGFPTYEALERRGLVTIGRVRSRTVTFVVQLTEAGKAEAEKQ